MTSEVPTVRPERENDRIALYRHRLTPRTVTVTDVQRLTPRMVRVRYTGADLVGFVTVAPEDHVKLFFDVDAAGAPILPIVVQDRWVGGRGLTSRDYTVRAFDRENLMLEIDFVVHGGGVAGRWADRAQPGDQLGMLGPRGSFRVKDVFDWYLMAVDETALPAASRWLSELRPQARAHLFVEVDGPDDELTLTGPAATTVTWLHRAGLPAGTTALLADAVRAFDRPSGRGFTWVAGEAMSIKPLRHYLGTELGLDRDDYDVDGYWRRGTVGHDHHQDDEEEG